jgi:arylsulfatase A-like enzyme
VLPGDCCHLRPARPLAHSPARSHNWCRRRTPGRGLDHCDSAQKHGHATGQFGKNHLGDLNKFLPTVHGFDEFFGYLYHLDGDV